jgi:hypothetical protein
MCKCKKCLTQSTDDWVELPPLRRLDGSLHASLDQVDYLATVKRNNTTTVYDDNRDFIGYTYNYSEPAIEHAFQEYLRANDVDSLRFDKQINIIINNSGRQINVKCWPHMTILNIKNEIINLLTVYNNENTIRNENDFFYILNVDIEKSNKRLINKMLILTLENREGADNILNDTDTIFSKKFLDDTVLRLTVDFNAV